MLVLVLVLLDRYREEGFNKCVIQGIENGIKKGVTTKALEITQRMLHEKVDIKLIASVTGLSTDEILKIQNKL